ncbi:uncharacterized protein LOC130943478 [Arachis stenosperma]|uniref:uncharacterized protein LOC130943478 n=1 Tax=Arachis stenosperma TaxID=217475 RepID=UPI0025AC50C3|nr:uncharacterized protein LOC130943478 [Arachis stenosperma]
MASVITTNCVDEETSVPIRPLTFVNLHKWPESDVEFVKRVNSFNNGEERRVNSRLWCRQMYLRSYKFSREKKGVTHKAIKRLRTLKESVVRATNNAAPSTNFIKPNYYKVLITAYAAFFSTLHKLMSCFSSCRSP